VSIELIVSSRAEADLTAAFDWYQARATDLGVDFLRCADATIALIERSPQIFRKRHGEFRMAMTPRFPYGIYFVLDEEQRIVSIRRVLKFSQNAPTHLK
jgi:plasmid stabilization system protein ParE